MKSHAKRLMVATVLGGLGLAALAPVAFAQMHASAGINAGEYDPAQLPEFKGKVLQYTLSPRGEVDGLILADGTEVQVPPHLSSALVFSIKPGDEVSIHGLRARAVPMISAVTVTNIASGAVVGGSAPGGRHMGEGPRMEVTGKVKLVLHTPRGEVNGVLLDDGTSLRLPPRSADKLKDLLKPGQTIVARGFGVSSPLGKAVGVADIGPSADKLTHIEMPHPDHWHHEGMEGPHGMMGGMMGGGHGMMQAPAPAPTDATPPAR